MKISIMDGEKKNKRASENNSEFSHNNENQDNKNNDDGNTNDELYKELKSKDELIEEYKEQLQRVQAEFINYRKRVENERKRDFRTAKGNLVLSILPVLDDFERLFEHYEEEKQCSIHEIKMLYDNLKKILCQEELTEIEDKGREFDPNCHEAVGVVETSPENDEMVMEVLQKGYKFGDKLLRPSRVKVGKHTAAKNEVKKDCDK
ncbi:MAG: nucleotide exchange factor GrpE [bacterium]